MSEEISPMPPFDWQQKIWQDFCDRVNAQTLPHAFLLSGKAGIGADELAMAMGQFLLCLSPLENVACGNCRGCQLNRANTHPDLLVIAPEDKGKQIKVDQIREISAKVDQTAQQGGRKIILIRPVEAMNVNASNALLKNLEEPAGDTVFILTSHESHRVLPTIRSRCAKIVLPLPDHQASVEWLTEQKLEDPESLLVETHGAPVLAKRWSDDGVIQARKDIAKGLIAIAQHRLEPMAFAKKWANSDPIDVLDPMLLSLESVILNMVANRPLATQHQALASALVHCPLVRLYRLRDHLCQKKAQVQRSNNLNAALFVEELILDWDATVNSGHRVA